MDDRDEYRERESGKSVQGTRDDDDDDDIINIYIYIERERERWINV